MTREEEIIKEAKLCASANTQIIGDWGEHYLGFIHGAEWADRSMITKVCEWLDENMNDVGIRFMRGDEIKDIVDLFRKAMKGE